MLISAPFPFEHAGQPAQLRVLRNDGFCWGRIVLADGTNLDVGIEEADWYDLTDTDAAQVILELVKAHSDCVVEPLGQPFAFEPQAGAGASVAVTLTETLIARGGVRLR
jgi:hypothetical protein